MRIRFVMTATACAASILCLACGSGDPPDSTASDPQAFSAGCPGAWQHVPTYGPLVGTYARIHSAPAAPGEMTSLTILTASATPDGVRADGLYSRTVFLGAPPLQSGAYSALADNPAVGPFFVFGDARFPSTPAIDAYSVDGIQKDAFGRVSAICFVKEARGAMPFTMVRVP